MSSVKYHRPWLRPSFVAMLGTCLPKLIGRNAPVMKVSGLGILFDNPLKSHMHCLTACVYHSAYVVGF